ncbi:MAG: hypothetical protein P0S95_04505 [Rhabdochlamydiaceae bacterium]|nr:hypothetical protein [Candidatus Amphrikana amoebophyrae]
MSPAFSFENDETRSSNPNEHSSLGSADAATTAINISMVGWGIGLTAAIAAITILVPPDQEGTTHSHSS